MSGRYRVTWDPKIVTALGLVMIGCTGGSSWAQSINFADRVAAHGGSVQAAFVSVLDDAATQPGTTIRFPSGTYRIETFVEHGDAAFNIPTSTTFEGNGSDQSVIEIGFPVAPDAQLNLFAIVADGVVTLRDLKFVGVEANQTVAIIHLGGAGAMNLEQVVIDGFTSPIKKASGTADVLLDGCEITARDSGFFTSGGGGGYDIRKCWFHDIGHDFLHHALYIKGPWKYINVVGNRFERIASAGVHRYGRDPNMAERTSGPVLIWDNIFEQCEEWGVILNGDFEYETKIVGNEFRECKEGIRIQSSRVEVTGNTIWGDTGILGQQGEQSQPSQFVRIVGNTLIAKDSPTMHHFGSWWGIAVDYPCRDWTIEGNRFFDEVEASDEFRGVHLRGARDCLVQGNEFNLSGDDHVLGYGVVTSAFTDNGALRRVHGAFIRQNAFRGTTGHPPNDGAIQVIGDINGGCKLDGNHFAVDLDIRETIGASSECQGTNWTLRDWGE